MRRLTRRLRPDWSVLLERSLAVGLTVLAWWEAVEAGERPLRALAVAVWVLPLAVWRRAPVLAVMG